MPTFGEIAGAEPSTVTFKLATVSQEWNSTVRHQEIVTIGGTESTLAQAQVLDDAPASTVWALAVRPVGYSTTAQVSSVGGIVVVSPVSTASVRVAQSTAADLQATVTPASTVWTAQVSTVGGVVAVSPVSTASVRVAQSTAADLLATVSPGSTTWTVQSRVTTSSGGAVEGSTAVPAGGTLGVHVRPVVPTPLSTTVLVLIQTAGGSTTLVSSAAGVSHRVFAYSVMSTVISISSCAFLSSAASEIWGLIVGTGSSGISGANLAVGPPWSLFKTAASEALGFSATSTGLYRVSIGYFTE